MSPLARESPEIIILFICIRALSAAVAQRPPWNGGEKYANVVMRAIRQ